MSMEELKNKGLIQEPKKEIRTNSISESDHKQLSIISNRLGVPFPSLIKIELYEQHKEERKKTSKD